MRKSIGFVLSFALFFVLAGSASANHLGDNQIHANGDPLAVIQPWGLNGHQTVTVRPGQSITDEAGEVYVCPIWHGQVGCSDVTRTEWYRNSQIAAARGLKALGLLVPGNRYFYWGQFVR